MNVIIIGLGSVGMHYLNLMKNIKNIKKIYILENRRKVKKKNKNLNFLHLEDIKKKKLKIHYAIICTPSGSHYNFAKYFLKNKIPTLIEKPLTISLKQAKELIRLKIKYKTKCWVAFQNRFNKSIVRAKRILNQGVFGKVFFVDAALYWNRDKKYYSSSWRGKYKSDGGVLFNQSIHLLDSLIYFFGKIKNFNVVAGFNKKKLQAEDLISINFNHKNTVISNLKATTRANRDYRASLDIFCEKGRVLIKGISLNKIFYFNKKHLKEDKSNSENFRLGLGPKSGMGNGHMKLLKEFFNSNLNNSSKNLEIEDNLYVLKVIHSVYTAIYKKKNYQLIQDKEFNIKK